MVHQEGAVALVAVVAMALCEDGPFGAFAMGLAFGLLFRRAGYPACAAAHVVVNLVGLLRLRRADPAAQG